MTTIFTFVCLSEKQVATAVDIQALEDQAYRRHALVWRDDAVIDTIERDGDWPRPAPEAPTQS